MFWKCNCDICYIHHKFEMRCFVCQTQRKHGTALTKSELDEIKDIKKRHIAIEESDELNQLELVLYLQDTAKYSRYAREQIEIRAFIEKEDFNA